jgi:hypothetical protein
MSGHGLRLFKIAHCWKVNRAAPKGETLDKRRRIGSSFSIMLEAHLYKDQLQEAKEHLSRWEALGEQLNRTDDLGWQCVRALRQAAVKQLELLIEIAETTTPVQARGPAANEGTKRAETERTLDDYGKTVGS